MRQVKFLVIVLLSFTFSCRKSNSYSASKEEAQIVINIDSVQLVSLKIGETRYVPLETSDDCLIGNVDKVLIKNEKIYISDFNKAMALFVFDLNGKYILKISKRGQGPGEYISFRDFDVNSKGDIFMFDVFGQKVLIFNFEGKSLGEFTFKYNFESFFVAEDRIYLSSLWGVDGEKISDLSVYDISSGKTTHLFDDAKFLYYIPLKNSSYNFYHSPSNVYYSPKFSEIIYSINRDSVIPVIGIKNLPLPPDDIIKNWIKENNFDKRIELIKNNNYFLENVFIYETQDYISFDYKKGTITEKILLINKRTKTTHALLRSAYFMELGCSKIMGSTGKEFFSAFFIDSKNQFHKQILDSREELKNWQEEDNPILVFFNLEMDSPLPF